jgi:uncharacterized protein YukE
MQQRQETIARAVSGIESEFSKISEAWASPAARSLTPLAAEFKKAAAALSALLTEAANRMQRTYQNLIDAETINTTPPATGDMADLYQIQSSLHK